MSPTSYQASPPRIASIEKERSPVKPPPNNLPLWGLPCFLPPAQPHQCHAERNDRNTHPAVTRDAFPQEKFRAEGARRIAERAYWNDKTQFQERQNRQQREKAERHETNSHPQPWQPNRLSHEPQQGHRAKVVNLAHAFHRAAQAQFASGAGDHNKKEEHVFEHRYGATVVFGEVVVFGAVRPTTNTPKQMSAIPAQRSGETISPSKT